MGKLFPHISCDLNGKNYEEEEEIKRGLVRQQTTTGAAITKRDSRAEISREIGSTDMDFDDTRG